MVEQFKTHKIIFSGYTTPHYLYRITIQRVEMCWNVYKLTSRYKRKREYSYIFNVVDLKMSISEVLTYIREVIDHLSDEEWGAFVLMIGRGWVHLNDKFIPKAPEQWYNYLDNERDFGADWKRISKGIVINQKYLHDGGLIVKLPNGKSLGFKFYINQAIDLIEGERFSVLQIAPAGTFTYQLFGDLEMSKMEDLPSRSKVADLVIAKFKLIFPNATSIQVEVWEA